MQIDRKAGRNRQAGTERYTVRHLQCCVCCHKTNLLSSLKNVLYTFVITNGHYSQIAVMQFIKKKHFAVKYHLNLLWPKVTTFEKSQRSYPLPKAVIVRSNKRPQHMKSYRARQSEHPLLHLYQSQISLSDGPRRD